MLGRHWRVFSVHSEGKTAIMLRPVNMSFTAMSSAYSGFIFHSKIGLVGKSPSSVGSTTQCNFICLFIFNAPQGPRRHYRGEWGYKNKLLKT